MMDAAMAVLIVMFVGVAYWSGYQTGYDEGKFDARNENFRRTTGVPTNDDEEKPSSA